MQTVIYIKQGAVPEQKETVDKMKVGGVASGVEPVVQGLYSAEAQIAAIQRGKWTRNVDG